jgi:hypothetical protein
MPYEAHETTRRRAYFLPMRIVLTVIAALVLAASGSVAQVGETAGTGRATLTLTDRAPLKLRGRGFLARERVRITVSAPIRKTKRVTASVRGSFVVTFEDVVVDRCHRLIASAVGNGGSRASAKLPQPQCPPPLAP